MITKNRKFGRGIESLEAKTLMAGDVAVSFDAGDLFLYESPGDQGQAQSVSVSQLSDGRVQVQAIDGSQLDYIVRRGDVLGRNQAVEVVDASTIRITGMQNLDVSLGEGNDLFRTDGRLALNNLDIDMGQGNDADTVDLRKIVASGQVNVATGKGFDTVRVSYSKFTSNGDALRIFSGEGSDTVSLFSNTIAGDVLIDTSDNDSLDEHDLVEIVTSSMDDLEINLGGGDDQLELHFVSADNVEVNAGSGDDDVYAAGVDAALFDYNGGSGHDEFFNYRKNYAVNPDNAFDFLSLDSVEESHDKADL